MSIHKDKKNCAGQKEFKNKIKKSINIEPTEEMLTESENSLKNYLNSTSFGEKIKEDLLNDYLKSEDFEKEKIRIVEEILLNKEQLKQLRENALKEFLKQPRKDNPTGWND